MALVAEPCGRAALEKSEAGKKALVRALAAWVITASLASGAANAAVIEVFQSAGWTAPEEHYYFQNRYGDNAAGGDWEFARREGLLPAGIAETDDFAWLSSQAESFTLVHNSATGELTFTLDPGGQDLSSSWFFTPLDGFDAVMLGAIVTGESDAIRRVAWDNLVLNTSALTNNSVSASALGGGTSSAGLTFVDFGGGELNGFTLSGTLEYQFLGPTPAANSLISYVGVEGASVVPIPAAVWMFASGLSLLLGWKAPFRYFAQ